MRATIPLSASRPFLWISISASLLLGICGAGPCGSSIGASDVNADGYIDRLDLHLVNRCVREPAASRCSLADANGDGVVDWKDRLAVVRFLGAVLFDPQWPPFVPGSVHLSEAGVLFLHSSSDGRIYRWSLRHERALKPIEIGSDSRSLALSRENRTLYVGYEDGRITQIDAVLPGAEGPFAVLSEPLVGLATAGSFVVAAGSANGRFSHHSFQADGTLADTRRRVQNSPEYAWSPASGKLYFLDSHSETRNDVHWESIDPETGAFSPGRQTFYWDHLMSPPLRVSPDGLRLILGSGGLYDEELGFQGALPVQPTDAFWLDDGTLLTLTETDADASLLQRWDAEFRVQDLLHTHGSPLRVFSWRADMVSLTSVEGRPVVERHVPRKDRDDDGTPNVDDAFPLDPAASHDSDGDVFPDAWNPGYGPEDSSNDLVVDAFPEDSACHLAEHATPDDPDRCDIAARVPAYVPERIESDPHGILYLLSSENRRIDRWAVHEGRYLNPILLDEGATQIAYSESNDSLYVGYTAGTIHRIDPEARFPLPQVFGQTRDTVLELEAAGRLVFAVDPSRGRDSYFTFAPDGAIVSRVDGIRAMSWSWNGSLGGIFFKPELLPADLHFLEVDPATGQIGDDHDTPYHGEYPIANPVRVSPDDSMVLLGSGDFYDAVTLRNVDSLPVEFDDAAWLPDGSVVTIRAHGINETRVEEWTSGRYMANVASLEGTPLRVVFSSEQVVVVTQLGGRPAIRVFSRDGDGDGDGVAFDHDDFPLDPAASLDSDGDGFSDAWNPGQAPADGSDDFALDAFPYDSACHLPEHAFADRPDLCDIASRVPSYSPVQIEADVGGVIHLLSPEHRRVFRWSPSEGADLNPIPLQDEPRRMAYSEYLDCLFVGYASGAITQIDLAAGDHDEIPFANVARPVQGLDSAGALLFVVDSIDGDSAHYTFAPDGRRLSQSDGMLPAQVTAWSAANERVYFFRDDGRGATGLFWEGVDPVSGAIGMDHSDFTQPGPLLPPIRVAPDGSTVFLGGGGFYDATSLERLEALPDRYADASWSDEGLFTMRSGAPGESIVERWSPELSRFDIAVFPGAPLRLLRRGEERFEIVTEVANRPAFAVYTPRDDSDGDGVRNEEDAFPIDPAASLDGDGDGAPDAWNPGYGPADSRDGLVLDWFPEDFACQLPEHSVDGACDFAFVIPESHDGELCPQDSIEPATGSGYLEVGESGAFASLCDGWLLIADTHENGVSVRNVVNGRNGRFYPLPGKPAALELDWEGELLFVALPGRSSLAELDLVTGDVSAIPTPGPPEALSLGPDGDLFFTVPWYSAADVYRLAAGERVASGGWRIGERMIRYNPVYDELIAAGKSRLQRYGFDAGGNPVLLQSNRSVGLSGHALEVSPDGEHVVLVSGNGNGPPGYTLYDFVASDIESHRGQWDTGAYPRGADFDRTSERLLALASGGWGTGELFLFDVASHAVLEEFSVPGCSYGGAQGARLSRDGALGFVRQACFRNDVTRFHWFRID